VLMVTTAEGWSSVACGGSASREEGRQRPLYRRARGGGRAFLARQGEGTRYGGATWAVGWWRRATALGQWREAVPPSGRWGSTAWPVKGATDVTYRSSWGGAWTAGALACLGVRTQRVPGAGARDTGATARSGRQGKNSSD
jgi:hypothetical protein